MRFDGKFVFLPTCSFVNHVWATSKKDTNFVIAHFPVESPPRKRKTSKTDTSWSMRFKRGLHIDVSGLW